MPPGLPSLLLSCQSPSHEDCVKCFWKVDECHVQISLLPALLQLLYCEAQVCHISLLFGVPLGSNGCVISCICSTTEMVNLRDCFWDSIFHGLSWLTNVLVKGCILFRYVKTIIQTWDPNCLFSVTLHISDPKPRHQFHSVIWGPSNFLSFHILGIACTTFTNYSANMHPISVPSCEDGDYREWGERGFKELARAQSCWHGVPKKYWLREGRGQRFLFFFSSIENPTEIGNHKFILEPVSLAVEFSLAEFQ